MEYLSPQQGSLRPATGKSITSIIVVGIIALTKISYFLRLISCTSRGYWLTTLLSKNAKAQSNTHCQILKPLIDKLFLADTVSWTIHQLRTKGSCLEKAIIKNGLISFHRVFVSLNFRQTNTQLVFCLLTNELINLPLSRYQVKI